jgi:PAS domain S-box-containing protein
MNILSIIGYPLFFVSLFEIILGILLLAHNPRRSRAQRSVALLSFFAAAFALITALMYVLASFGRDITPLARANWIGWLMIPAAFQIIFYLKDENSRSARLAGAVLYPFWVIVFCLSISTDLIERGTYTLIPHLDQSGLLAKPLRTVAVLQLIWLMYEIFRLRRSVIGIRRAQLNYFTHGMLIFTIGGTFVSGVLQLFGGFGLEPGLGSYFSLPWVVLTFYAMTRYRLFDIRSVVARVLTVGLLSAFFSAVQVGLFKLLEPAFGASFAVAVSLCLIGFVFFGTTFSRKVQAGIQRVVLQDKYDYQKILKESITAIIGILDLREVLLYLIRSIKRSLGVENACLVLRERNGQYRQQEGIGGSLDGPGECVVDGNIITWIAKRGGVVIREELERELPEEEFGPLNSWMRNKGVEVIIPLFSKGQLPGVLALGGKGNREPYVQSDIDLLETLAGHAAIALENARLYDDARRAKESLQESESKFRALAETTPAAIFIHRGGAFLYANPLGEAMTGYTNEELLSLDYWSIVHPDFRDMVQERGRTHPQSDAFPPQYEFKIVRKDGAERWALMTSAPIEYEGKPAVIGTLFDITERKALEGQLRYAQKMEAIGKLAGGVAHDFNNVLSGIVGYASILHAKIDKNGPLRFPLDQILAATERAANMTQTLLAFGKKQVVSLKSGDLNDIVRNMEKLLAGLVRGKVVLTMRYAGGQLPILADSSQIERVLMNLLVNARDAMPDGGTVTLETGNAELDNEFIKSCGYGKAGSYAVVSMTDTGTGMDPAIREKIFEPFFTTKGLEKGTGFGLSIVYDIVKEHRGYITADSEPGRGTTFKVFLPLAGESAASGMPAPAPAAAARGSETVLVADNDHDVREFIKAVLDGHGFTVIEASDGGEAISKFMEHKDTVQLLILDVIMPTMNGSEAFSAIRRRRPKVKVLFTSGYKEEVIVQKGLLTPGQHFMEKPFSLKELLAKVREVLDENQPRGAGRNEQ